MANLQNETNDKKFVLGKITDRIFIVVPGDQLKNNGMYVDFPLIVHGVIKVMGESFETSYISYMFVSDEFSESSECDSLFREAREYVFHQY